MKDLGNLGESVLQTMCFQVGLTANVSKVDANGWDAFVEFPLDVNAEKTFVHDSQAECKVQVKATSKNKRGWDVSLSNLRKMATYPGLAFYLFLKIDDDAKVEKAYLVHLDRDLIWKVLQRVDREKVQGNGAKLNKKTMTIKYGKSEQLSEVHGKYFKLAVEQIVGGDFSRYVRTKTEYLEKAGYEQGAYELNFETSSPEGLITFHEMSLGVDKELEVSKAEAFEKRFGLKRPGSVFGGAGVIRLDNVKPKAKGTIFFKEARHAPGLKFDIELYASPLSEMLPNEKKCFRVNSELFELLVYPFTSKISYKFKLDYRSRHKLKDLKGVLELVKFFYSQKGQGYCKVVVSGNNDIDFTIHREGGGFEHADDLRGVESLVSIERCYHLEECLSISLEELNARESNIKHFENMLFRDSLEVKMELDEEVKWGADEITGIAFFQGVIISNYLLGVCIVMDASGEKVINGRTVYGRMPVTILDKVCCDPADIAEDEIMKLLEDKVSDLPDDEKIIILDMRPKNSPEN
ncbi:hypothetical protein [Salinicola halophyticus]|uniref:hypothetical protein n=1 Tax=Salinicola halophyticus TaxID=1808881 RepID=UPI001300A50D|nr:hypothetical protein [Salinicola halophyticus]